MADANDASRAGAAELRCECGYLCCGATVEARVLDGQDHARTVHGIDVSPDQVLTHDRGGAIVDGGPKWQ